MPAPKFYNLGNLPLWKAICKAPWRSFRIVCSVLCFGMYSGIAFGQGLPTKSPDMIVYIGPGTDHGYTRKLLKQIFTITEKEFGPFQLEFNTVPTASRAYRMMIAAPNQKLIYSGPAPDQTFGDPRLIFVDFPIYRGVYSYRVCLSHSNHLKNFPEHPTLPAIKKATIGQGKGWRDVDILRRHGFSVFEADTLKQLYAMLTRNRFDFFCRSINEVLLEKEYFQPHPNIKLESTFALYYPLTFNFSVSNNQSELAKRLSFGLNKLKKNGDLKTLWQQQFGESIEFSNIKNRKLYLLEPLENLSETTRKNLYTP